MQTLLKIGEAVRALEERTGDKAYGSHVQQGKYQLVKVEYKKGASSRVTPVSDWMVADDLIAYVNSL